MGDNSIMSQFILIINSWSDDDQLAPHTMHPATTSSRHTDSSIPVLPHSHSQLLPPITDQPRVPIFSRTTPLTPRSLAATIKQPVMSGSLRVGHSNTHRSSLTRYSVVDVRADYAG